MEFKGQSQIAGIAIAALVFLVVLVIYGQVQTAMNINVFGAGVQNLINLIPLVLVGSVLVGIIIMAFKLSN